MQQEQIKKAIEHIESAMNIIEAHQPINDDSLNYEYEQLRDVKVTLDVLLMEAGTTS